MRAPMLRVGCAGFSIPQSRYFQEFLLLEVQETALRVPGAGTVSRWQREAPEGFEWTLLAPNGLSTGDTSDVGAFLRLARTLGAKAAVVQVAPGGRSARAALRKLIEKLPQAPLRWVVETGPDWSAAERKALAAEAGVVVAVDPLAVAPPPGPTAYFRFPGPAGHRSRYDESAIHEAAAIARGFDDVFAIFCNADMHTDAKRLEEASQL
jgi:uncharacterized protein YecE (DUF72 family)